MGQKETQESEDRDNTTCMKHKCHGSWSNVFKWPYMLRGTKEATMQY